jgi:hypothetical protein
MELSREARLVTGITLLIVPTIMYGGATLLGVLTKGVAGLFPEGLQLDETQWALFRAGHAHAGVWIVLVAFLALRSPLHSGGCCTLVRPAWLSR